jgi:hypothetical protein
MTERARENPPYTPRARERAPGLWFYSRSQGGLTGYADGDSTMNTQAKTPTNSVAATHNAGGNRTDMISWPRSSAPGLDKAAPLTRGPLLSFVRECCNHTGDVGCHFRGRCAVQHGIRCDWFERAVLDLARLRPDRFPGVLSAYGTLQGGVVAGVMERVRTCECGEALPPRRRLCDSCQNKHRKAAYRQQRAKSASHAPQLNQIDGQKPQ